MFEYTHLIVEGKSKFSSNVKPYSLTHNIIDMIESFYQVTFNYLTFPPIKIKTKPILFILQRKNNYKDFIDLERLEEYQSEFVPEDSKPDVYFERENNYVAEKQNVNEIKVQDEIENNPMNSNELKNEVEQEKEYKNIKLENKFLKPKKLKNDNQHHKLNSDVAETVEIRTSKEVKQKTKAKQMKEKLQELDEKRNTLSESKPDLSINNQDYRSKEVLKEKSESLMGAQSNNFNVTKNVKKNANANDLREKKISTSEKKDKTPVKDKLKRLLKKYWNAKKQKQVMQASTKTSIKRIIEKERHVLEMEELSKLHYQIVDIIDNNPNIINKEAIKMKIQDAIEKEINDIEMNATRGIEFVDDANKVNFSKNIEHLKPKENLKYQNERDKGHEKPQYNKEDGSQKISSKNVLPPRPKKKILPETIEIYSEEINNYENGLGHYDSEGYSVDEETEELMTNSDFDEARMKIENIMSIIDEIVTNIEITEAENEDS